MQRWLRGAGEEDSEEELQRLEPIFSILGLLEVSLCRFGVVSCPGCQPRACPVVPNRVQAC
jgi:hypothetical protein